MLFPQYYDAPSEGVRNYIVHGGLKDGISDEKWQDDLSRMMGVVSERLVRGGDITSVNPEWDKRVLETIAAGELSRFDSWADADMIREGGQGGSEIRLWIAALAAGKAAGGAPALVDYYSDQTTIGVGAGIVHAPAT
jgi:2,3-dihydroxyphenylpropionate 1,2-dioxygenase